MHKIISSHLKTFSSEYELEQMTEEKKFEHFVNYCVASKYYSGRIDTQEITTGDCDDAGIDGVIIIADGELITTEEEIRAIFESHKRNLEIDFIFVQAKTSPKFEKKEIANFGDGVFDFLSDKPEFPHENLLSESRKIFDIVIDNVAKVKSGKPNSKMYFVTTGIWNNDAEELSGSLKTNQKKINGTGYFGEVQCLQLDRDKLIRLWSKINQPVEATVKVKGFIPYENIKGVEEAYICVIPAKNFISSLLEDDEGRIKSGIFEENVRAFLGEENSVNSKIQATLESSEKRDRFAILNNGITIVSPDIRVQSDTISLFNYQIVNGCQTSHVLFRKQGFVDDSTMLTVKVIEVNDENIVNQIVEATNNQSYVADEGFLSLKSKAKNVESYFNSCNDEANGDSTIYFERREKQYEDKEISKSKIFDIKTVARAFSAMFLEIPHTAKGYPKRIFQQSGDRLFKDEHNEITYYCATLALYKFNKLSNSKKLPENCSLTYKWHILMLLKYVVTKQDKTPELNSKKITKYCEKIIKELNRPRDNFLKSYEKCVAAIEKGGGADKDKLKTTRYTEEFKKILMSQL